MYRLVPFRVMDFLDFTNIFCIYFIFLTANAGAAAGGILFFLSYLPYLFLQKRYNILSTSTKVGTCLFSNVAMAFGAQVIGMFEGTGMSLNIYNYVFFIVQPCLLF